MSTAIPFLFWGNDFAFFVDFIFILVNRQSTEQKNKQQLEGGQSCAELPLNSRKI